jgi:hypothetical protein
MATSLMPSARERIWPLSSDREDDWTVAPRATSWVALAISRAAASTCAVPSRIGATVPLMVSHASTRRARTPSEMYVSTARLASRMKTFANASIVSTSFWPLSFFASSSKTS